MRPDPLTAALREVTDTKRLLEALIISSESFDYPRAKATLQELNGKIRTLGKMQAELSGGQQVPSERVIPFPVPIRAGP